MGDWYDVTVLSNLGDQTFTASVFNLGNPMESGTTSGPIFFWTNTTSVSQFVVGRGSVTAVNMDFDDIQVTFIPEPSTAALVGIGMLSLLAWRRKHRAG